MTRRVVNLLGAVFLAAILLQTALGVVVGYTLEVEMDSGNAWLLAGVLAIVSVTNLVIAMGVVLPNTIKQTSGTPTQAATLGYAFADAQAVYGLVAAVLTGVGLVALGFGLFALIFWAVVRNFLSDYYRDTLSTTGG